MCLVYCNSEHYNTTARVIILLQVGLRNNNNFLAFVAKRYNECKTFILIRRSATFWLTWQGNSWTLRRSSRLRFHRVWNLVTPHHRLRRAWTKSWSPSGTSRSSRPAFRYLVKWTLRNFSSESDWYLILGVQDSPALLLHWSGERGQILGVPGYIQVLCFLKPDPEPFICP